MLERDEMVDDVEPAPVCARPGCGREDLDRGPFCTRDAQTVVTALGELPSLYLQLRRSLVPSSGAGSERVSGSREAPLPLRTEVASLADDIAGTLIDLEDALRKVSGFTPAGRQVLWTVTVAVLVEGAYGPVWSPRKVHESYDREAAIKATRDAGDRAALTSSKAEEPLRRDAVHNPDEASQVINAARFVGIGINQLLEGPTGGESGLELINLRRKALATLGHTSGDVPLPMPCPQCGATALVRCDGDDQVVCEGRRGGCGEVRADLAWLMRVLATDMPDLLLPTVRAAELCGVDNSTVAKWAKRGHLKPAACTVGNGRVLYRVGDVLELATRKDQPA